MDCTAKPELFPNFYRQAMWSWFEIKKITNKITNPIQVRREFLWLNEIIKINKKQIKWN
jgi:hypothetical protein